MNSMMLCYLVRHHIPLDYNAMEENINAVPVDILNHELQGEEEVGIVPLDNHIEGNAHPAARKIAADHGSENSRGKLVTLFTTMKLNDARGTINNNTLRLWASMKQWANVVLFVTERDDPVWQNMAKELGWSVYLAPRLIAGVPVLKDMFTYVIDNISPSTPFVGYANSDIVFTESLESTLSALMHANFSKVQGTGLLLIGRRTKVYANTLAEAKSVQDISLQKVTGSGQISENTGYSLDYFITTHNGYPWHRVPDFIVGKPGYDNWLVVKALDWNLKVIDLSVTCTVLHQELDYANGDSGWFAKNVCINRDLMDPISLVRGKSDCAPYFMKRLLGGSMALFKRVLKDVNCWPEVPIWGSRRHITCHEIVAEMAKEKTTQQLDRT